MAGDATTVRAPAEEELLAPAEVRPPAEATGMVAPRMVVKRGLRLGVAGAEAGGIGASDGRPRTRRGRRGGTGSLGGVGVLAGTTKGAGTKEAGRGGMRPIASGAGGGG